MRAFLDRVSAIFARTIGGYSPSVPSPMPEQSHAIAIARVICILGVVYAHAWTGQRGAYLLIHSDSPQGMMRAILMETIGRSAVPLLGMISGWLVAGSALKRGYWSFVKGKARTILAPMLIWNALALALVGGAMWMGWNYGPRIFDMTRFIFEEITSFSTMNKINFQTPFLRDLFVLMLLAPLLIRLRSWALALLTLVVLAWSIFEWWFPLIIRPQVALFFLLGILARRWELAERVARLSFLFLVPPFLVFAAIKFDFAVYDWWYAFKHREIAISAEIALRFSAAALVWRICIALARQPRASAQLRRIEPYAFFMFCSHMIFIWLFDQHIGRWVGPIDTPYYPIFFVLHPLFALIWAVLLAKLMMRISPAMVRLLSGGRLSPVGGSGRLTAAPGPTIQAAS